MAATSTSPAMVDPAKTAKYPVVLSDALLGKTSTETYTGIRYNLNPDISDPASTTARLKPSSQEGTFSLGLDDNGNRYTYNGVRTTKDGNYVLIFDPSRQVFVLHRVDSLFHMNVTRTPDNSDVDSLRKQFPQLDVQEAPKNKTEDVSPSKSIKQTRPKASSALRKPAAKKSAAQKKQQAITTTLPMPDASKLMPPPPPPPASSSPSKSKKSARSPGSEEDDSASDSDDGGLTIEYPGGDPAGRGSSFTHPPVAITRRFSDFVQNGDDDDRFHHQPPGKEREQRDEDEDQQRDAGDDEVSFAFEDAIGGSGDEEADEEMDDVKLPSPLGSRATTQQEHATGLGLGAYGPGAGENEDDADGEDDDDDDGMADLEADLEAEFEKATGYESESDVSEED